MGLAHLLGLDDGGERYLCTSCGRFVRIETGDDVAAGSRDAAADDDPACPNCGSQDVRRIALF